MLNEDLSAMGKFHFFCFFSGKGFLPPTPPSPELNNVWIKKLKIKNLICSRCTTCSRLSSAPMSSTKLVFQDGLAITVGVSDLFRHCRCRVAYTIFASPAQVSSMRRDLLSHDSQYYYFHMGNRRIRWHKC